MAMDHDDLGDRGEAAVSACLRRPLGPNEQVQFRPMFLGQKAELLDFLVFLVGEDKRASGPHFFLQVKTSSKSPTDSVAAVFSAGEVARVKRWKTPTYLAAVDASVVTKEDVFVRGIDSSREKGISSIPKIMSLNDPSLRNLLYQEVEEYFQKDSFEFKTKIIKSNFLQSDAKGD